MALGVEASVEAVEVEQFAAKIPSLIPKSNTFWSLAQDRFTKVPVSSKPLLELRLVLLSVFRSVYRVAPLSPKVLVTATR